MSTTSAAVTTPEGFYVLEQSDYDVHPFTGLLNAIKSRNRAEARSFLSKGMNVDASPSPPLPKMTPPIIEAVCTGDRDLVELLLEHRASLKARDVAYGGTVLHWAAASGNTDMLAFLLERAVDPNMQSYAGQTPLQVAAGGGHDACLRLLLSENARPNLVDLRGDTALHEAAGGGYEPAARTLLAGRANPNAVGHSGETPLIRAARRGHSNVIEVLLDSGGAIDLANEAGITALMSSAFYGHDPVVSQLLQRGANARSADRRKRTALHWAAMNDHDQAVKSLMVWAADAMRSLDTMGASPLDLAMEADAQHAIAMLRSV